MHWFSTSFVITLVPSSPQNVQTQDVTSTSITLIWKPPQNPNGRLHGYEVSYMPNGGSPSVMGVQNTTTWKLTGLKPYTVYTISVRAKTGAGFGASTRSSVTTLEDGILIPISCVQFNKHTYMYVSLVHLTQAMQHHRPRPPKLSLSNT